MDTSQMLETTEDYWELSENIWDINCDLKKLIRSMFRVLDRAERWGRGGFQVTQVNIVPDALNFLWTTE